MKIKSTFLGMLIIISGIILSNFSATILNRNSLKFDNKSTSENYLMSNNSTSEVNPSKTISMTVQSSINMRDFVYLLVDSNENYPLSDSFIEDYQQASGGYIDFAKQIGHSVNKTNHEPNQKWHFLESWMFQSFKDGTLTWEESAKTRVYSKLLCPELLLWIYEACGVDSTKVTNAYNAAKQGKEEGKATATIAKNMRGCVSWDDIIVGLNNKTALSKIAPKNEINEESTSGITVGAFANFLAGSKEHYALSNAFIKNYQQVSGGYIDFANSTGHEVDKDNYEPNQRWHFFESWLLGSLKNGSLTWEDDARSEIYMGIESPELLLWIYEACGVNSTKVANAKAAAENGKNTSESSAITASKMRECVSWDDVSANISTNEETPSVTLSPKTLELIVGGNDATITASVNTSNTSDTISWSISEGNEFVSISPNGNRASIHAIKEGTAKIKASLNESVSDVCSVSIKEEETSIEGLPSEINLDINETMTLNPSLNKGSGTFTFESNGTNIATVTGGGVVRGVAYGSTTITVSCVEIPELVTTIDVIIQKPTSGVESLYSTCLFGASHNSKGVNNYTSEFSSTNNGFTWNLKNFNNYNNNWNYVKTGSQATASVGTITTNSAYSVPVSKAILTIDTINSTRVSSISLLYGTSIDNLTHSISIDTLSAGNHTFSIPNPIINQYYRLSFDCMQGTANGFVQISKIEFYKQESKTARELADDYATNFNLQMQQLCPAPYNAISESDWTSLSNSFNELSSDSKQVFRDQFSLYLNGNSDEAYTQLFSTYCYIVEVKYGWSDFMELGLTPKAAPFSQFNLFEKDNYFILLILAIPLLTMIVFGVFVLIKKDSKNN